jgi:hypothetical protein
MKPRYWPSLPGEEFRKNTRRSRSDLSVSARHGKASASDVDNASRARTVNAAAYRSRSIFASHSAISCSGGSLPIDRVPAERAYQYSPECYSRQPETAMSAPGQARTF